jgi:hypothetical protein
MKRLILTASLALVFSLSASAACPAGVASGNPGGMCSGSSSTIVNSYEFTGPYPAATSDFWWQAWLIFTLG